jgi:AraC-like DNA-binding protein
MRCDKRIEAAIEESLQTTEGLTVARLAAGVGLSPSRFSHLFVLQTGMLPGHYIRLMKRLRKERRLALEILGQLPLPYNTVVDVKDAQQSPATGGYPVVQIALQDPL